MTNMKYIPVEHFASCQSCTSLIYYADNPYHRKNGLQLNSKLLSPICLCGKQILVVSNERLNTLQKQPPIPLITRVPLGYLWSIISLLMMILGEIISQHKIAMIVLLIMLTVIVTANQFKYMMQNVMVRDGKHIYVLHS